MSLELLKQDLRILIPQTCLCVIVVIALGNILLPIEIALRNPVVFFVALGGMLNHYYAKYQAIKHRLEKGWTVRGNVTE